MKRLFLCLCLLTLLPFLPPAAAEEEALPDPPVLSALSEDGLSYDDGTLSVRIVPDVRFGTNVFFIYVTLTDPAQMRTVVAGRPRDKVTANPLTLSARCNAVLAINGDFYKGHDGGLVYRNGQLIRNALGYSRDELFIDENGDLNILTTNLTNNKELQALVDGFPRQIVQAFCWGPGLIIDGKDRTQDPAFNFRDKTSCGYPTPAQRMVFCQLGPLEYMFFATEGKEQNQPGLTIPEVVSVLTELGTVQQAYNLDGGSSTTVILCGNKINAPKSKPRDLGDIICFTTLAAGE